MSHQYSSRGQDQRRAGDRDPVVGALDWEPPPEDAVTLVDDRSSVSQRADLRRAGMLRHAQRGQGHQWSHAAPGDEASEHRSMCTGALGDLVHRPHGSHGANCYEVPAEAERPSQPTGLA